MPYPLAHPAAVLPLRRCCPRWFNFPALVIGSLCPDAGYYFGPLHLEKLSHRFVTGSFEFCLPVGLLLLLLFYSARRAVVERLPSRLRRVFEPLCLRPAGSPLIIAVSLLVGSWTHIFLDSLTHENGWLVEHLPVLQANLVAGKYHFRVCDLLYAVCTCAGAAYVAVVYLTWLEWAAGTFGWIFPGFKPVATLAFAAVTLLLSFANHSTSSRAGLVAIGFLTAALATFFFAVTVWGLRGSGRYENDAGFRDPSESTAPGLMPCQTVRRAEANQLNQP
jgi:hypothetical protein